MIKNHIKIAWRNLLKNKGFSAINIIGLAIGMAAVLLIALWVQNQFLYDNFYNNKKDIYKLWNHYSKDGQTNVHDITAGAAANTIKEIYPEVEYAARMYWSSNSLLTYGEKSLKTRGNEVDADFLQIFDFPVASGDIRHALAGQKNIVLTVQLAKSLFEDEDPLEKTVILDNDESYRVAAVLADLPSYTDFDFSYLVPLQDKAYGTNWNTNTYYTYIGLRPGTDINSFNKKIEPIVRNNASDLKFNSVFLYPISKMHLYSRFENGVPVGGKIEQVRLVAGIGLLILCIACINFINLSTARSQKRAKEVGVRKVVGARKSNLISQFLTESVLLSVIAGITAIGLSCIALPLFNQVLDKPLSFDMVTPLIFGGMFIFMLCTGLLAGIYPAFVLSAFQPVKTIKGLTKKNKNSFSLREVLVVLQFGIAIVLIIATLIVRMQINYASERNAGYNPSQLIEIPVEGDMNKNYEAIKAELLNSGAVKDVTRTGWSITKNASVSNGNFSWEGATPEQTQNTSFVLGRAESDFIKTVGLTLVDGRDLDYARLPADSASVLLNEAAIKTMGLENPVGKYFKRGGNTYTIVGVFKNYINDSPYEDIAPMAIFPSKNWMLNMVIRTSERYSMQKNLQTMETIIKKFNPAYPFSYSFVDEEYAKKFHDQRQMASLSFIFSMLAIAISCLGLFGLASYIAETRTKEIGIRKVLGASVWGISGMLSKDFVKLMILAILLASPIAWWVMNKWLEDFSYRIAISWWVFVAAGAAAIAIALFTVSTQAIKAARANPVDSLRDE
ncbi:ABC transporter permease [Sphingobacterium sp. SGR-19]|uniref:ABC transporter permease n=1 Tax=Sphingobacterium sp. SGR-19 TaxID=2710886 RepID=UPI0013EC7E4B|nr:ABC transporter permease [Sphingobacterium sp. SGR-19]NGM66428.1 FtsX-like permease family protein [Sphingobacterium sp. SGR-19]